MRFARVIGLTVVLALLVGAVWLRLSQTGRKWLFEFITRSDAHSSRKNDYLLVYPIAGMFIGGLLACVIIFRSMRRGMPQNTVAEGVPWVVLVVIVFSIVGMTVYGHYFG